MAFRYEGKIPEMEYKTLRYPGHAQIMETIRELGLLELEPVDVKGTKVGAARRVRRRRSVRSSTKPKGRDLLALRVIVAGTKDGQPAERRLRAGRPLRRGARDQRDDAHDRLLAVDHRPDAGARRRSGRRACGRRTSACRPRRTSPSCGRGGLRSRKAELPLTYCVLRTCTPVRVLRPGTRLASLRDRRLSAERADRADQRRRSASKLPVPSRQLAPHSAGRMPVAVRGT